MKRWILTGALVAASMMLGAGFVMRPVQAQQEQNSGTRVAVVDVNKVFKEYAKFKTLSEELKASIQSKEDELRTIEQNVRAKAQQAQQLRNQADRDRVEKEIADLKFDFEKKRRDYQNEFLKREATIYSSIYKEMSDVVAAIAKHNGIHLVLRLKDDVDEENPQAVLQTINRQVVYSHEFLDITQVVIESMNK